MPLGRPMRPSGPPPAFPFGLGPYPMPLRPLTPGPPRAPVHGPGPWASQGPSGPTIAADTRNAHQISAEPDIVSSHQSKCVSSSDAQ